MVRGSIPATKQTNGTTLYITNNRHDGTHKLYRVCVFVCVLVDEWLVVRKLLAEENQQTLIK